MNNFAKPYPLYRSVSFPAESPNFGVQEKPLIFGYLNISGGLQVWI